jgi:hypothetical protein
LQPRCAGLLRLAFWIEPHEPRRRTAGFDLDVFVRDGYRADLMSISGKTMRVYFFDYDTFAWGMSCPDNNCVQDSRFIMLNKSREPLPRRPPI